MALGSHLITVRRLEKYINDVIGKKANLPDTSKTIIGNISQINSDLTELPYAIKVTPTTTVSTDSAGRIAIENNFTLPSGALPILIVAINGSTTYRFTTPMYFGANSLHFSTLMNDLSDVTSPNNTIGAQCVYIVPRQ